MLHEDDDERRAAPASPRASPAAPPTETATLTEAAVPAALTTADAPAAPVKRSKYEKKKARIQRRKAATALAAAEAAAALERPLAIARSCPPWIATPELLARVNDRALPLPDRCVHRSGLCWCGSPLY